MIHVFLRDSESTRSLIPNFERFLDIYNLKIIDIIDDNGIIELRINAMTVNDFDRINSLISDFYNEELIGVRIEMSDLTESKKRTTNDKFTTLPRAA